MPAPGYVQDFLPLVARPARYVGGEVGAREPDPRERLRVVMAFPDVYEVGMCNNGLLFLYEILGDLPGVTCERVFTPDADMAAQLRVRNVPLYSLETGRPVREADVLGITVPSPVNYTAALSVLALSGVPLLAAKRNNDDPLVIAGGHAVFNPEPFSAFADACFIGEADEAAREIARLLIRLKDRGASRVEKVEALACVSGVYIPSLYRQAASGTLEPEAPAPPKVRKRTVRDIAGLPHPVPKIIAWVGPVHDRAAVEVARGCIHACRFCQAGAATRPYRERPTDDAVRAAREAIEATGTGAVSLLGLNPADYSGLDDLLTALRACHPGTRISLPAVRLDKYGPSAAEAVSAEKPGQQTFAPEAGTERLRRAVGKNITDDEVLEGVRTAGAGGVQRVKLYFMLGLPTETDADVIAIAKLSARADKALRDGLGRRGRVTVKVSAFVPQAHTPFQWCGQLPVPEIRRRLKLLRKNLDRRIKFSADDPRLTVLEAALARGGRDLGPVILAAYVRGAKLDGWRERFKPDVWREAYARASIDMEEYAARPLTPGKPLPWGHIDVGLTDKFLRAEYEKALKGETTPDCLVEPCAACGACAGPLQIRTNAPKKVGGLLPQPSEGTSETNRTDKIMRIRFPYAKTGLLRFLGHLDLARFVIILLARAKVPLTYGSGFAPRPRLELAPALPACAAGTEEWGDAWLHAKITPDEFVKLVSRGAAELGIKFATRVGPKAPSLARETNYAEYACEFGPAAAVGGIRPSTIKKNLEANVKTLPKTEKNGPFVSGASYDEGGSNFAFTLVRAPDGRSLSPYAVARALSGIDAPLYKCIGVTRIFCGRLADGRVSRPEGG